MLFNYLLKDSEAETLAMRKNTEHLKMITPYDVCGTLEDIVLM